MRKYRCSIAVMICIFIFLGSNSVNANAKSEYLEVKNEKCLLKYKIEDIKIENDTLSFQFNINEKESKNVYSSKVVVKDDKGKVLADTPEDKEGYYEKIVYKVNIENEDIEKINIIVYAFPEKFEFIEDVDMSKVPYNGTTFDIETIKDKSKVNNTREVEVSKYSFTKQIIKKNTLSILIISAALCTYLIIKFRKRKEQKNESK